NNSHNRANCSADQAFQSSSSQTMLEKYDAERACQTQTNRRNSSQSEGLTKIRGERQSNGEYSAHHHDVQTVVFARLNIAGDSRRGLRSLSFFSSHRDT